MFARAVSELSAHHRVIVVDLPGFGDSAKPLYKFTIPFYADVLVRLLDHLDIRSCLWAGHSMGAQIATFAALEHPARVESLVLASPAGIETFSYPHRKVLEATVTPAYVRKQTQKQIHDGLLLAFHRMPLEASWLLERRLRMTGPELDGYAHAFAQGVRAMLACPVRERLRKVAARTLILMGGNDRLVPNRIFHPTLAPHSLMRPAAPELGAKLVMFPGTGHLLPFEKPVRFADEVLAFSGARSRSLDAPTSLPFGNVAPHNKTE